MEPKPKRFVVISGATGRLGYHVVREFVNLDYEVRILCRSLPKAQALFFDIFEKLEILEVDFYSGISTGKFPNLFQNSRQKNPVTHIVSISGASGFVDRNKTEVLDYKCHKYLIDAAKNIATLERFIYVSSMNITRAWSFVSLVLNLYIKNVMAWKLETENYLRSSGLNYVIVRPGGLLREKDSRPTAVTISQGDRESGLIERGSVAKVIVSVAEDKKMKNKVSFEIFSRKEQMKLGFEWVTPDLKQDQGEILKNSHFTVRRIVIFSFSAVLVGLCGFLFKGKLIDLTDKFTNKLKK